MTVSQANAIKYAYQQCCSDESLSGDAIGSHWLLINAVERAGIHCHSREEALEIACNVCSLTDEEILKWKRN